MTYALMQPTLDRNVMQTCDVKPAMTYAQIGKTLRISAKRVRDIEQAALRKLRERMHRKFGIRGMLE